MSDDFDQSVDNSQFSSFWPLLIVIVGLLVWFGIQDYELNRQRVAYQAQIEGAIPSVTQAQNFYNRYVALMKDLVETAQKNPNAQQIVKDAAQAGWIKVQPNATNSTTTPAAPAPASK